MTCGEWTREELILEVPYRQIVFTIPKLLRVFFKFKRKLLGALPLRRPADSLITQGRLQSRASRRRASGRRLIIDLLGRI
jgi:hypothetical protein